MKRKLSLLLCAALSLSLLSGCGGGGGGQSASLGGQETSVPQESVSQEPDQAEPALESYPVVLDYYDKEGYAYPEGYAYTHAPDSYLDGYEIWNSGYDSDTREDITVGDFSYRVYNLDDSTEKIAVCCEYVGPTDGVTEVVIPGQVNGITVFVVSLLNTLPDSVTMVTVEEGVQILHNAFLKEPNLACVKLPESLVRIFESFTDLPALSEVNLPSKLYWLQGFHRCSGLTQVTIPESVGYIQAFDDCNLESVTIEGTGLYCLDYNSFRNNPNLTKVDLPDSVHAIAAGCFMDTAISEFDVPACLQDVAPLGTFNKTNQNERILQNTPYMAAVEDEFLIWNDHYLVAYMGNATSVTIPDGITHVCNHAFAGNTTVQEIIVPEGVEVVDDYAIWGTTSLTHLDLPASLTYFGGFSYDTKKTLPKSFVASIPQGSVAQEELDSGKTKLAYTFK